MILNIDESYEKITAFVDFGSLISVLCRMSILGSSQRQGKQDAYHARSFKRLRNTMQLTSYDYSDTDLFDRGKSAYLVKIKMFPLSPRERRRSSSM